MSTKELWLARKINGRYLVASGKVYKMSMGFQTDGEWLLMDIHSENIKALGLPTIRKGTKKKIRLTVEVL